MDLVAHCGGSTGDKYIHTLDAGVDVTTFNRLACCRQVMKLLEKQRNGSKVRKRYDQARTPYKRVLAAQALFIRQNIATRRRG